MPGLILLSSLLMGNIKVFLSNETGFELDSPSKRGMNVWENDIWDTAMSEHLTRHRRAIKGVTNRGTIFFAP